MNHPNDFVLAEETTLSTATDPQTAILRDQIDSIIPSVSANSEASSTTAMPALSLVTFPTMTRRKILSWNHDRNKKLSGEVVSEGKIESFHRVHLTADDLLSRTASLIRITVKLCSS